MRYRSATVADSHGLPRCLRREKNKRTMDGLSKPDSLRSGKTISIRHEDPDQAKRPRPDKMIPTTGGFPQGWMHRKFPEPCRKQVNVD
jgi:hypothetical protein